MTPLFASNSQQNIYSSSYKYFSTTTHSESTKGDSL